MKYGHIPGVDKPVSRIIAGTALPTLFNAFRSVYGGQSDFDQRLEAAFTLLDGLYAQGVNCFDCADHYGEEPLGEWLSARGLHDKVVILTKGAHHNAWRKRVTDFDILHDVHNSLAKLQTDKLDMYLLHRDDPAVDVGPLMEALNRCWKEGKIGAFGVSNWTVARIEEANRYALDRGLQPFTLSSPNFGLAVQVQDPWGGGCISIAGEEHREDRAWYSRQGMPVIAYSALGRGLFSGRVKSHEPDKACLAMDEPALKGYACPENFERLARCEKLALAKGLTVPQTAMAWLFSQQDLDVYALVGVSNPKNMQANIQASQTCLTREECMWLNLETDKLPSSMGE